MKRILLITTKQEGLIQPSIVDSLAKRGIDSKEIISDKKVLSFSSVEALVKTTNAGVAILSEMETDCITAFKNCSFPVGVIYLSSEHDTEKIRSAYSKGADMCLSDRLDPDLLPWQIEAVYRHYPRGNSFDEIVLGEYKYNPVEGILSHPNISYKLTPKQRMVFEYLANRRNKKVLKKDLLHYVYGETTEFAQRSMDVHVSQLRRMLAYDTNISIRTLYVGTMSLIVRGEADFDGVASYAK